MFLCGTPAKAANPYIVQYCPPVLSNTGFVAASNTCNLHNTVSGDWIIVGIAGSGTTITVTTATEALTCLANAKASATFFAGAVQRVSQICYVQTASSHSTFTVTITLSGGAFQQIDNLFVHEVNGYSGVDTASAANAATLSTTVTTAGTNEQIEAMCSDYSNDITTGTSMLPQESASNAQLNNQGYRAMTEKRIAATATGYTVACTSTNSQPATLLSAVAFNVGSPSVPTIQIVQVCYYSYNGAVGTATCPLHNTTSGNKIIMGIVGYANATITGTISGTCTETCTFPAGTLAVLLNTHSYGIVTGYSDTTTSHALFQITTLQIGSQTPNTFSNFMMEVSGLNTGADAGSAAAANATSVSYTTAANQEYTFTHAIDSQGSVMSPGGSFVQMGIELVPGPDTNQQAIQEILTTAASGSHTASYTGPNSTPLISTLSFGQPSLLNPRHSQVF